MNGETEVSYYCPYCESETSVIITIYGPTEYCVADECCPNCDAQIEGGTIDQLAAVAVADYFASRGDLAYDEMRDREMGL